MLALALAFPSMATAQTTGATTGSLNGKVVDPSGAVLPGVTVTAASPALQGVRTATTSETGEYRVTSIPPGVYRVTYELSGFATIAREGLAIGIGFTATVNVEMKVAQLPRRSTSAASRPWST